MLKAVKLRVYPSPKQEEFLAKSFGCVRWFWNYSLNLAQKQYECEGKIFNRYESQKLLPILKKQVETSWLKEPPSQCLQSVLLHLDRAFKNFYEKRAHYPKFKNKHGKQSLSFPQDVTIEGKNLKFPKIGSIPVVIHREIKGKIKTVTLSKNKAGQYFASILLEDGLEKPKLNVEGKAIGIDLGLTHFITTSDGSKIDNPRWYKKHDRNLKNKQRQLSRKIKGSKNRNKSRVLVAKVHAKIERCRTDFHHKLSRSIVNENQIVVVEDLAVKNLVKNHKLARAISQVGWGQFCTMLKYKAEAEGKIYQEVGRFFASSKTCSVCLNKIDSLALDIRSWNCDRCKTHHDRDINAAVTIRNEGLRILNLTSGTGDKAYCPNVSLNTGIDNGSNVGLFVG